jgi:hypothetical protein
VERVRGFFTSSAVPSPLSVFPKINPTQKQRQLFMAGKPSEG